MPSNHLIAAERYQHLQQYLDDGWDVDPPIFVRPAWHTQHQSRDAYHFILKRAGSLHLLVLPVSPELDQFVQDRNLPLNRL